MYIYFDVLHQVQTIEFHLTIIHFFIPCKSPSFLLSVVLFSFFLDVYLTTFDIQCFITFFIFILKFARVKRMSSCRNQPREGV